MSTINKLNEVAVSITQDQIQAATYKLYDEIIEQRVAELQRSAEDYISYKPSNFWYPIGDNDREHRQLFPTTTDNTGEPVQRPNTFDTDWTQISEGRADDYQATKISEILKRLEKVEKENEKLKQEKLQLEKEHEDNHRKIG